MLRTDRYTHCPDLVLNSVFWPDDEEVAAFEELVGSHGGMGGRRATRSSSSRPTAATRTPGRRADTLHHVLRRWLAHVGQDAYADPPGAPMRPKETA